MISVHGGTRDEQKKKPGGRLHRGEEVEEEEEEEEEVEEEEEEEEGSGCRKLLGDLGFDLKQLVLLQETSKKHPPVAEGRGSESQECE
ncbi:uncharacterized protein V6R79_007007 [Siganus canaliculatus]